MEHLRLLAEGKGKKNTPNPGNPSDRKRSFGFGFFFLSMVFFSSTVILVAQQHLGVDALSDRPLLPLQIR